MSGTFRQNPLADGTSKRLSEKPAVLVVDDEESIRETLRVVLENQGYRVETAETAQQALKAAELARIHSVLLDIHLPDAGGMDLLEPLKHTNPDMGVLILTGNASVETAAEAVRRGAWRYLTKPLNLDQVLQAVRESVERQRQLQLQRETQDELECRVRQRTQELAEANAALRKEIEERKRSERELAAVREELAAELKEMVRLHELGTRLSPEVDFNELLREILEASVSLLGSTMGCIQLLDHRRNVLTMDAAIGYGPGYADLFCEAHPGFAACGCAWRRGARVIIEDVRSDPVYAERGLRAAAARAGYRAVCSTPLFTRTGEFLGTLSVNFRQPHRPSDRELRHLDLYARQAAEIIEAASRRLERERIEQRLEVLVHERTAELGKAYDRLRDELEWRQVAERALRESERKYRMIVENSPLGICHFDAGGVITAGNEALLQMLDGDREDLIGSELLARMADPQMREAIQAVLAGRCATYDGRYTSMLTGKTLSLSAHLAPIQDDEGVIQGGVAILQDVSARREAEQALHRRSEELARSNADLQKFAYIASHDLQEPLRMVASFLGLIQHRYGGRLDGDADTYINQAVEGARRMQALIRGLLAYSRLSTQSHPRAAVSCRKVLEQVLSNLQSRIDETGAKVLYDAMPTLKADEIQLVQLFQNLIENALKFRGNGDPEIRITAENRDGGWHFCVRDNGIGFEPEYAERIFVIFQRLHSQDRYPGAGIGLAVCKRIVERHGGRIWVESDRGRGASFHFVIPQQAAEGDLPQ